MAATRRETQEAVRQAEAFERRLLHQGWRRDHARAQAIKFLVGLVGIVAYKIYDTEGAK